MARKIKVPNEIKKRHEKKVRKRLTNIRAKRIYYLIVCEGERTEVNYFEGLKKTFRKGF
jgi:hypothetical protein